MAMRAERALNRDTTEEPARARVLLHPVGKRRGSRSPGRMAGILGAGLLAVALLAGCKSARSTAEPTVVPSASASESASASASTPAVGGRVSDGAYVALGDSYTAAPLLAGQGSSPAGCLRSADDYPALVAGALHPRSFTNVSCYGASTGDMTHQQETLGRTNPPQLSAVSAADSLVTVQVGGDDIGFSRILATCGALSLTDPFGSPCQDHYTDNGADQLAQTIARTAPKVTALLDDIRQRAPHAQVLVIGYPDILPVSGNGCWPEVPIARGDIPYLRDTEVRLNAMLAAAAARAGVEYVDIYDGTIGHDACQSSGVKWIEGLIPTSLAVPLHPNAAGEQAMARLILDALRG
jgi:lysophospholipase L1-like esterase